MAGDWIPIETDLASKPEVLRVARETGRSRHEVVGLLVSFWGWCSSQSCDGSVAGVVLDDVPHVVGGDREFYLALVNAGWLVANDDGINIPRFGRWLSNGAKSRLNKNRRQAAWRDRAASCDNRGALVDAPPSTKATTREEKRREEKRRGKKETEATPPLVYPPALDTPEVREAWSQYIDHRKRKRKPMRVDTQKTYLDRWAKKQWGVNALVDGIEEAVAKDYISPIDPDRRFGRPADTGAPGMTDKTRRTLAAAAEFLAEDSP
ncbi:hypothetical protein [uncultured Mediterranean phage uvDeep-CGR2-KM19-C37]|nr:hypothetical protein [uncultured Mediterranean phage uvDeep-CGR2-KM19-C37]